MMKFSNLEIFVDSFKKLQNNSKIYFYDYNLRTQIIKNIIRENKKSTRFFYNSKYVSAISCVLFNIRRLF